MPRHLFPWLHKKIFFVIVHYRELQAIYKDNKNPAGGNVGNLINIEDDILHLQRLGLLDKLLYDRTTKRSIIWASDAHAGLGDAYRSNGEIRLELITGDRSGVIKTRARKELSQRSDRTRKNGEVFTPLWICRKMIDHADEMWRSETEDAKAAKIKQKTASYKSEQWQRYIDSRRLEITCGEAPYLVSRYDVATGEEIPVPERIGILDRKMRAADEHTATESEWLMWAFRSFEATYGYELLGDSLLIARVNLFMTFEEYLLRRWNRRPSAKEYQRLIRIITWNVWQADGLTGKVPRFEQWDGEKRQRGLFDGIEGYKDETQSGEAPYCRVFNWRSRRGYEYGARRSEGGKAKVKFDFIIGNPPYQGDNESSCKSPVYNLFMDAAYQLGDVVELITPARFLFNAGQTPKEWNKKMLNDEHLKVLYYEPNGTKIFPNTDIKGGVVITYRDADKVFGKIGTFTSFSELRCILEKVVNVHNGDYINAIISNRGMYRFSDEFFRDYPSIKDRIAAGTGNMLTSKVFFAMPECFEAEKIDSSYIGLYGRNNNHRVYRYIKRKYIIPNRFIDTYNIFIPKSNGSGVFGEPLSTPIIGEPAIGHTDTFLSIGCFYTQFEAEACLKYIRSKFARTMLGILKVTQDNPPAVWRYIPIQDFSNSSDIDWSKSIADIDRQLYAKYGLSDDEINFIETQVKEMA